MRIVIQSLALVQQGDRFGRLVVAGQPFFTASFDQDRSRWHKRQTVVCECDCGRYTAALVNQVRRGKVVSCGCYMRDLCIAGDRLRSGSKSPVYKHGKTGTRLYRIWSGMLLRCGKSKPKNHRYAGRGIRVCDEWRAFETFEKWAMSNGYEDHLSIDRIDNDGNYEPSNCRWATSLEQAQNRSTTKTSRMIGNV